MLIHFYNCYLSAAIIDIKKSTGRIAVISIVLLLVLGGGGCASPPTVAEFYRRESERLHPPERRLLVETLRVLLLLEDYSQALESKKMDEVIACYSSRYSYYENGLDWLKDRIRDRFFEPFGELTVSLCGLSIELVQKDSGYWLRQEDFDWLEARGTSPTAGLPAVIALCTDSGTLEMVLDQDQGLSCPASPPSSPLWPSGRGSGGDGFSSDTDPETVRRLVTVRSSVDPGVERPLGEVSFRLLIKGGLADCRGSEVFTSSLAENVILLLEKEDDGNWKIISQW